MSGTVNNFSPLVQIKSPENIHRCFKVTFHEFIRVSKEEEGPQSGAIYLSLQMVTVASKQVVETKMWFPRRVCCNLDLENKTIIVWKTFLESKLDEYMDSLLIEPEFIN